MFTREVDQDFERMNIDCEQVGSPPIQTRISVWSDGRLYFRTCQSAKKGWRFKLEMVGNAFLVDEAEVVRFFEESLSLSDDGELMSLWEKVEPKLD